jgi:hypothetical protein
MSPYDFEWLMFQAVAGIVNFFLRVKQWRPPETRRQARQTVFREMRAKSVTAGKIFFVGRP